MGPSNRGWYTMRDMMPERLPAPSSNSRKLRLLLTLPKFGIVLLVVALVSLLWLLQNNEAEEERATLIKDVLWLEQNMRFHLAGNEDQLQQLAVDLSQQADARKLFKLRAAHILKNNPEITQLLWLNANRKTIDALPSSALPDQELEAFGSAFTQQTFEQARQLGMRTYSAPFFVDGKHAYLELMVPVFDGKTLTGMLVAVTPVETLLNTQVPWWFTQKYQVVITDDNDTIFAAKTSVEGKTSQEYEIPFDPPGQGLKLRVTSYQNAENTIPRILTVAIIVLAGGVLWSLWLVRDLMRKRSQAEEALRAEHAFRKAMEDSLTVGMRARDLKGKVIYVNPAFCRITGFSSEELVGTTPPMPYWVPEQIDETFAMHQSVLAGLAPPDGFEMVFQRKNGEHFNALVYEAKLIDGKGQHTGWMASVLDITERKRAEELARQQQAQLQFTSRLVTMGEMASTLAHELNQPLAAIASYNTGCLNLLERPDARLPDIKTALEKIGLQAQRAGKIIRRVHDFVRKSEPKRAPCALGDIVEDCLGFVESDARKNQVRIEAEIPELAPIAADRLMLEQVLLNLMRNAMEAMSGNSIEDRRMQIKIMHQDNQLSVSVSDQGSGIAPEHRDKLFTAFFTTKPDGMGIGLSICRSIIEFHRGRLWAEDNPQSSTGRGTIFTFTLPLEQP